MLSPGEIWQIVSRKKTLGDDLLVSPLRRCLGTLDLTLIGIGHMVGSGVYVVSGKIIRDLAGPAAILSSLLAAVCALLAALCYAELGAKMPKAGSAYTYTYVCLGECIGFIVGWNTILECMIAAAAVAKGWSATLNGFTGGVLSVGCIADGFCPDLIAVVAVLIFSAVIAFGVRASTNVNNVLACINLCFLTFITGACYITGSADNVSPKHEGFAPYGFSGILAGAATSLFSFIGFEAMSVAAEEAKTPSVSLPRATIYCVSIVTIIYFFATSGLVLLVPFDHIIIETPYQSGFSSIYWLKVVVSIGILVGTSCTLLGNFFNLPRGVYAMSSDGLLFKSLAKVHPWTQTPLYAILMSAIFTSVMACFMPMEELIELLSAGTLSNFFLVSVSVLVLRYQTVDKVKFPLTIDVFQPEELKNSTAQQTALCMKIGRLKPAYSRLSGLLRQNAPMKVIAVLSFSVILFTFSVAKVAHHNNFYLFQLITSGLVIFLCIGLLKMHVKNIYFADYMIPWVPGIPIASMMVEAFLLWMLQPIAILRFVLWIVIGLVVYALFGANNSKEDPRNYTEDETTKELLPANEKTSHEYNSCQTENEQNEAATSTR